MEPNSHISNEGEECQSSESGWTMYIGSPDDDEMNYEGDFDEDEEDVGQDHKNINDDDDDDDDTDDSMASDASSGPSHIVRNANKSTQITKEKGNIGKGCSNNKTNMKKGSVKNQEKGEYSVYSAKGAKVPSNGEKTRGPNSAAKGNGKGILKEKVYDEELDSDDDGGWPDLQASRAIQGNSSGSASGSKVQPPNPNLGEESLTKSYSMTGALSIAQNVVNLGIIVLLEDTNRAQAQQEEPTQAPARKEWKMLRKMDPTTNPNIDAQGRELARLVEPENTMNKSVSKNA
ncbi:hypothetical protein K7X08_034751 [Anisodus acutangulus]|uniref:Uncharacterized protein n=1 Tax=Anisodus acutangulus TaxID=402998 RepID=A0A9Q1LHI8_9SOLA|nr:hypothetical protein K7X08_034751 [Anisodus acutangulus]